MATISKKVEEEKSVQEVALSRIDSLPEKIRKKTELLNKSLDKLKTQESALVDKLSGIEKYKGTVSKVHKYVLVPKPYSEL